MNVRKDAAVINSDNNKQERETTITVRREAKDQRAKDHEIRYFGSDVDVSERNGQRRRERKEKVGSFPNIPTLLKPQT